ncbi:hypothetical protein [Brevibacterium zhoupengii]|uniref:hypothetical protein n=1 Tax=Brevibacterium zhoupengii TaxID=2898795 RepID=UPI001E4A6C62|nr:hypothetical protein [Brevibacterium zhoupengii]
MDAEKRKEIGPAAEAGTEGALELNVQAGTGAGSTNGTEPVTISEERRIIGDAIARGHQVTRWTALIIGLLFIASGLWLAGVLVLVVTVFDLPRIATERYARKRGARLDVPSLDVVEKASLSGLLIPVVFFSAICGLIVVEAKLGHPLLPWSWKNPQYREDDLYMIVPFVVAGLVPTIAWFVRRRKHNRHHKDGVNH